MRGVTDDKVDENQKESRNKRKWEAKQDEKEGI